MLQQTNSIQNLLEQPPVKSERAKRPLLLGAGVEEPQNRLDDACFGGSVPSKFSQILKGVNTPFSSQNISESGTPNQLSFGGIPLEVGLEEQGISFEEPSSENGTPHVSNQASKRLNIDPKEAELSISEEEGVTLFSAETVITGKRSMGGSVGEGALLSPNPLVRGVSLMGQAKVKGEENNATNNSAISFDGEEEIELSKLRGLRGEGMATEQNIPSQNQTAMPQAANPAASLISHPYSYRALNQLHQQQVVLRQQQTLNKEVSAHSEEGGSGSLTSMSGFFEGGGDKISSSPIQYASITHAMTSKKWGEALGKHLQVAASQSLQKMQITLNPEKLGPIQVNLHLSKDKQLHIGLAAHHVVTREAMLEALPRLREMLESQGVSLGSMDVSDEGLAQQDFTENSSAQKGQGSDARFSQETEVLSEANVSAQALLNAIDEQGRVDYYA